MLIVLLTWPPVVLFFEFVPSALNLVKERHVAAVQFARNPITYSTGTPLSLQAVNLDDKHILTLCTLYVGCCACNYSSDLRLTL